MSTKLNKLCLALILLSGIAHAQGPGDIGSVGGKTDINQESIQGEYLLQGQDVYLQARIVLNKNIAVMKYADTTGKITCKGNYQLDQKNLVLVTKFAHCGNTSSISHVIFLAGKDLAALKSSATVSVSIAADNGTIPNVPFTLTKEK